MEEMLRDLQQAMDAHREALAAAAAGPSGVAEAEAAPRAGDPRQLLLHRLAGDVERVSGIAVVERLENKLARVLAAVDLAELTAWTGRLRLRSADDPEWLSLIEALTVHETFVHRDRPQLDLLARILPDLIADAATAGRHCLRLWSAGCASGEEAYTLAILALRAMLQAGFARETRADGIVCRPPWRIEVLGTDISRLVLTQARAAVYSSEELGSFRDLPPELERFFPVLDGHPGEARGVLRSVARHVRFRQFNLVSAAPPERDFDVILCRNVLMYLTDAARVAVQSLFPTALRPGGLLLLGPTDVLADPAAYAPRWGAGAVAYTLKPGR